MLGIVDVDIVRIEASPELIFTTGFKILVGVTRTQHQVEVWEEVRLGIVDVDIVGIDTSPEIITGVFEAEDGEEMLSIA